MVPQPSVLVWRPCTEAQDEAVCSSADQSDPRLAPGQLEQNHQPLFHHLREPCPGFPSTWPEGRSRSVSPEGLGIPGQPRGGQPALSSSEDLSFVLTASSPAGCPLGVSRAGHAALTVIRTLGPPLENNPEIPPSSREEGLRLLHGLATNLAKFIQRITYLRRRQWHPTPVLLPGKSHGQRSLVGCNPWGR